MTTKTKMELEHRVVSQQDWLEARKVLLANEKEFTRLRDKLSAERRELPWVKVEKKYVFDTPEGKKTLADLFDGRSQLIVQHFMLGPGWKEGCPGCSFMADHVDGARQHFEHHDVKYVAISRAPLPEIEAFKKRMGWGFDWASSFGSDFNYDYNVSFDQDKAKGKIYYNYETIESAGDEQPGLSVFYKDESGGIFHTYSTYARGGDILIGAYNFLDMTPKGRNETEIMDWMRHHDKYDSDAATEAPLTNLEPPKFVDAKPMFIAGIERRYKFENKGEIPEQWKGFVPHLGNIPGQAGGVAYGVCNDMDGGFRYLTGVEVADPSGLPNDFTGIRIPAQRYAVFSHREHVSTMSKTIDAIWKKWLPESGNEASLSPLFFERYGEGFDPKTEMGDIEIWVPIKT